MGKTLNDVSGSLLEELVEELNAVEIMTPDDITVSRLAELTGKDRNFITRLLKKKVKGGELVCVSCYNPETGRRGDVYRKVAE